MQEDGDDELCVMRRAYVARVAACVAHSVSLSAPAKPAESAVRGPTFSASNRNTSAPAEPAESDATHQRLLALLRGAGARFSLLTHAPTKTSAESAAVRGVPLASGAKAMLLKVGGGVLLPHGSPYVLAVMSASRSMDLGAVRALLGVKKIALAGLEDVYALTGVVVGAVPPFGSLFERVATIADESIIDQGPQINFNAALRSVSVIGLPVADYLAIERPRVAAFTTAQPG